MAPPCKPLIPVLALAGLIGCSEPTVTSKHWTAVPGTIHPPAPSAAELQLPTNSISRRSSPAPPPAATNELARPASLSSVNGIPDQGVSDWVALDTWSELNHLGAPRRLLSATNFTFELHTTNGVIALTAGSNLARFNGLTCCLGHAPRLSNGQFVVHVVDAEKNVRSLAGFDASCLPVNSTIVIDAGHGGENAGTRCVVDSHFEKDFTLDWALRLKSLLTDNGWNVVLTRTNDVDVSLADRVGRAEQLNASLFISLHFNSAFPRRDQSGIETFCLTPVGLPSTLARDFEDDVSRVYPNNAYDNQNLQYAVRLHRALIETTGAPDRGVRRARFMGVLRGQNRPAILIEGGYLSNPQEAALIASPEYRQKLAEAVANALKPATTQVAPELQP